MMPMICCMIISITVLWYFRTRNPVKRFRPSWGEVTVLGVVLFGISAFSSYLIYRTIETGADSIAAMKEAQEENEKGSGPSGSGKVDGSGGGSVFEETLTDIDNERREAAERQQRGE